MLNKRWYNQTTRFNNMHFFGKTTDYINADIFYCPPLKKVQVKAISSRTHYNLQHTMASQMAEQVNWSSISSGLSGLLWISTILPCTIFQIKICPVLINKQGLIRTRIEASSRGLQIQLCHQQKRIQYHLWIPIIANSARKVCLQCRLIYHMINWIFLSPHDFSR